MAAAEDLLRKGKWREGWALWDRRPERLNSRLRDTSIPEWRGQTIEGQTILVVGEQGLGDEIMFVRYLPLLRALKPSRIVLAVLPLNVRAFSRFGADQTVPRLGAPPLSGINFWLQVGSFPVIFETTLANIPPPLSPIVPIQRGGGIGFIGQGQPAHTRDSIRSMPKDLVLEGSSPLIPTGDTLDSFETVGKLDAVVSVDTSWAHMAGTLGKPTWILLSHPWSDWRWLEERSDSPWYPSARLVRQEATESWRKMLSRVSGLMRADKEYHDTPPAA